jgi:hypothetical protein
MDKEKSQEINEQIQYGLKNIDSEREVNLSLKDFLYTYKAIEEFRRFFHQPMHYPTLVELNKFLGNSESGAYSILNDLYLRTLDKYLPEDITEEIENGDKLNHPEYPFYYNLKKDEKFNLTAAGNTEPSAFELIKEMGFEISKKDDTWTAENYNVRFNASSPMELLGLITLYQAKGEHWHVSDEKIEQFIEFDGK